MLLEFRSDIYGPGAKIVKQELEDMRKYLRLQDVTHDWPEGLRQQDGIV
jgi:hypothetical protein